MQTSSKPKLVFTAIQSKIISSPDLIRNKIPLPPPTNNKQQNTNIPIPTNSNLDKLNLNSSVKITPPNKLDISTLTNSVKIAPPTKLDRPTLPRLVAPVREKIQQNTPINKSVTETIRPNIPKLEIPVKQKIEANKSITRSISEPKLPSTKVIQDKDSITLETSISSFKLLGLNNNKINSRPSVIEAQERLDWLDFYPTTVDPIRYIDL